MICAAAAAAASPSLGFWLMMSSLWLQMGSLWGRRPPDTLLIIARLQALFSFSWIVDVHSFFSCASLYDFFLFSLNPSAASYRYRPDSDGDCAVEDFYSLYHINQSAPAAHKCSNYHVWKLRHYFLSFYDRYSASAAHLEHRMRLIWVWQHNLLDSTNETRGEVWRCFGRAAKIYTRHLIKCVCSSSGELLTMRRSL